MKKWYHTEERRIMKKIIGIIFISLMFANIGFAEMKLIEEKTVKGGEGAHFYMATICIDGYKFALTGLKSTLSLFNRSISPIRAAVM